MLSIYVCMCIGSSVGSLETYQYSYPQQRMIRLHLSTDNRAPERVGMEIMYLIYLIFVLIFAGFI